MRKTESNNGGRGLFVFYFDGRSHARDVQDLEVVEPLVVLGEQTLALHTGNGIRLNRVQRHVCGVGDVQDERRE